MAVLRYDFHSHPKIAKLPLASVGLYAKLLSYCSGNLTDGHIPDNVARQMDAKRRHFGRLMAAELVDKTADGYQLRGYLDHNPSKGQVEAKREQRRLHMRELREAKKAKRDQSRGEDVTRNVTSIGKDKEQNPSTTNAPSTPTKEPTSVKRDAAHGLQLNGRPVTDLRDIIPQIRKEQP